MYHESTILKKARNIGYMVSKGFMRYLSGGIVPTREIGYLVTDMTTGFSVWGSYNELFTHLWSLSDVNDFIESIYEANGLSY